MIEIIGIEDLNNYILENEDSYVIIYFGADWCGPCKKLKDKISDYNKKLNICYIDIDNEENKEITEIYEIKFLPTQIFIKLKNNKVKILNRIDGYDWSKFQLTVEKY